MLPSIALVGLLLLPPIGILAYRLLLRLELRALRLSSAGTFVLLGMTFIALVLGWILLFTQAEVTLGGWTPVSLTGIVLALKTSPAGVGVMIALLSVQLDALLRNEGAARLALSRAVQLAAVAMVIFGDNVITLLVGLALSDLLHAQAALAVAAGPAKSRTVLRFTLNLIALALLLTGFAAHYVSNQTLVLSLTQLPGDLATLPAIALGLRLGFIPFSQFALPQSRQGVAVDLLSTLVLQARLAEIGWAAMPDWYYFWALLSVLQGVVLAMLAPPDRGAALSLAAAGLASTSGLFGSASGVLGTPSPASALLIAALTWTVGSHLFTHTLDTTPTAVRHIRRWGGALALLGLPPTVAFTVRSGLLEHSRYTESGLVLAGLMLLASLALAAALAWSLRKELSLMPDVPVRSRQQVAAEIGQSALLAAPLVGFTFATGLFSLGGVEQALSRNGVLDWIGLALVMLAGIGGWFAVRLPRERLSWLRLALAYEAQGVRLAALLIGGAFQRLSAPFARVFDLLEGESALIWTVILVLLVLLIARGGQP